MFEPSTSPDITEPIPAVISAREASALYANAGLRFDMAVGGLPFMVAASDSRPYQRATADFSKQQLDTSHEAGEQTLSQWWTRSQDSWHRGEGQSKPDTGFFYEPGSDEGTQYRYGHSVGVNVWTKGQVTLLHNMDKVASVVTGQSAFVATGGAGSYFTVENGNVRKRTPTGATVYTGVTAATAPCMAGTKVLVGTTAGVWAADTNGSTFSQLYTSAGAVVRPWWAKSRIIATKGNLLYELALTPSSPPVALPVTPTYTHPLVSWAWSAVSDSPGAILAAGYADGLSAIYRFSLEDATSGDTPVLGQAYQVAEFPPGEQVTAMRVYLGQYVAIGTSRGVRVGIVSNDGTLQYGPLIVETAQPVLDFAARDSFIYAAVTAAIDGSSGAVRINLGEGSIGGDDLRFAYAWDVQVPSALPCSSVAFVGNTDCVVLGVTGDGIYLESATNYVDSGYVTSGKIRYATTELKAFKRVRVNGRTDAGLGAGVSVFVRDNRDAESFMYRITSTDGDGVDLSIPLTVPIPNAAIRLQLDASDDKTATPVLDAMVVKAIPSIRRQRLIRFPLQCKDKERDRFNNAATVVDGAASRLFALEELESSQATVLVQDFRSGDAFEAQVESVEFSGTTPPDKQSSGFGGFVTLTVRRLV